MGDVNVGTAEMRDFKLGTPALVCRWRLASGRLPLENRHLRALSRRVLDDEPVSPQLIAWAKQHVEWTLREGSAENPNGVLMLIVDEEGQAAMTVGPYEPLAATSNGYSTDRNGSAWALVGSGAAGLGLKSEVLGASASSLRAALQAGKDVICVMGPGTFTRVGHFIALDGLDADGRAIVHDSNSYLRSHQSWDLDLIVSEMNCAWALSVA